MKDASAMALEHAKAHTRKMNFVLTHTQRIDTLLFELDNAGIEPQYVTVDAQSLYISVAGDKQVLNKAYGVLRKNGLDATHRPEEKAASYSAYFNLGEEEYLFGIHGGVEQFKVCFSFSSTVCRRVKTGTRMVEEDIYEVQCEDESEE